MFSLSQKISVFIIALAAAAAVAACGGNPPPANNANTETTQGQAGQSMAAQAPIPRNLHCAGPIVWVNLNTKAYHEQGDPYFGRTKHGQYMCQAAANAAGDHLAGTPHNGGGRMRGGSMNNSNNMMNGSNTVPTPTYT
jgi:hypothetical protein